jgi:hypothetical protein
LNRSWQKNAAAIRLKRSRQSMAAHLTDKLRIFCFFRYEQGKQSDNERSNTSGIAKA